MSSSKAHIRRSVLFNRRLMDAEEYEARNLLVLEKTKQLIEGCHCRCAHLYLPIKRNKECDTWPLLQQLTAMKVAVIVSATDFEDHTMKHFHYNTSMRFDLDKFGIPTPTGGEEADLHSVDIVFVPLVAVDRLGNRIGYGQGYYDQMLEETGEKVLKVGLSLSATFDRFGFTEPHDIRLDYVITPNEQISCHE